MDLAWMSFDVFWRVSALLFFTLCLVGGVAFFLSGRE